MKKILIFSFAAFLLGITVILWGGQLMRKTSTNEYCNSCHNIHPQATTSWKQSVHYDTGSGVRTRCVECHLPPKGEGYFMAKVKTGARDVWGKWTKDPDEFDWEEKSLLENAKKHVYNRSCEACHENIFPASLSKEGEDAHLYYSQNADDKELHCINCHLNAGHYIEGYSTQKQDFLSDQITAPQTIYDAPTPVTEFKSFEEKIPGSAVSFKMMAVPGGEFTMGSPSGEPFRSKDEEPRVEVRISPFFMGEVEVTWNEYLEFYRQTSGEGRSTDTEGVRSGLNADVDAIVGATPPYGQPDQNWGLGTRPAITMRFHAAQTYCKWLSKVTGKTYRLPTEAEWEYACRAQTQMPYFFEGDPKKFHRTGIWSIFADNDTAVINSYVIYNENSPAKTQTPDKVLPNPFGLKNMLGNVDEFCSDWYQPDAYENYTGGVVVDPTGPENGTERVIRGGSFRDDAGNVRCATRGHTRSELWMKTDPQMPKSIWWYSDCNHVGFRVVMELPE